jgi:hypothetical protein
LAKLATFLPAKGVRLLGSPLALFAAAYALSAAVQKGAGFVIIMWLGRVLSVDNYARLGLLMALQAGLTAMASAGVVEAVIGLLRDASRRQCHVRGPGGGGRHGSGCHFHRGRSQCRLVAC